MCSHPSLIHGGLVYTYIRRTVRREGFRWREQHLALVARHLGVQGAHERAGGGEVCAPMNAHTDDGPIPMMTADTVSG